jgi:hypothetical protein
MGLEGFAHTLYCPEEALKLRQGKLRGHKALEEFIFDEKNVSDAAEILILLDDAHNFYSQADIVERAMSYGWTPVNVPVQKSLLGVTENRPVRNFWQSLLIGTAKFLLRIASED